MADRPQDAAAAAAPAATTTTKQRSKPSAVKTAYLVLYNFVSAILWSTVLGRTLLVATLHGYGRVFLGVGEFAKWTQTLALLEVAHAALGVVRAPLLTTAMQVASRFVLVWGIVDRFPNTTALDPVYSSMLFAWSTTEVIRYSYFACNLYFGDVPDTLLWLRYNTFFVLYPLGISSECWLMYKAIEPAQSWNLAYGYVIKAILFIYIPGSYILFTHMMAQRRKVLRQARASS